VRVEAALLSHWLWLIWVAVCSECARPEKHPGTFLITLRSVCTLPMLLNIAMFESAQLMFCVIWKATKGCYSADGMPLSACGIIHYARYNLCHHGIAVLLPLLEAACTPAVTEP
jgi:hypothetical protein